MKSTEELIERLRGWHIGREVDLDEVADRLEELSKERADMVAAIRKRCCHDHTERGMPLRVSALFFGVSPTTLSKWTAIEPTTEPDFVD
jgi:hypothetical protein